VAEKYFGKAFVVEYQPGGGGRVAYNNAARQPAKDGYTLLAQLVPNYVLNSLTYPEGARGYNLDDFDMLGTHACVPSSLIVKKGSQFKTLDHFVAYAKAHPGEVAVSVAGARSGNEVFRAAVDKELGIKTSPIIYNSGSDALKALLGGEVMAMSANINWEEQIPDQIDTLMVAAEERYPSTPEVPTMKELGYNIVDCLTRGLGRGLISAEP
jgi:tripartite-type tricarboxylate transporter receptor subunit TctC